MWALLFPALSAVFILLISVTDRAKLIRSLVLAGIFICLILRIGAVAGDVSRRTEALIGRTATIEGTVKRIVYHSDTVSSFTVGVSSSSEPEAVGITLTATAFTSAEFTPGDSISATVTFEKLSDEYTAYNYGLGRYYICQAESYSSAPCSGFSLYKLAHVMRENVRQSVHTVCGSDTAAVLTALLIGDDSDISAEFDSNVQTAGISHMLVVSGMHLGIICGLLMRLINSRLSTRPAVFIGLCGVLLIAFICLFHSSVMRAGIAYAVMLIARIFYRDADPLSSLGTGILVAVFIDPYIFYSPAFLLSVTATFAVIYPAAMITASVNFGRLGLPGRALSYVFEILVISVCASVCTLPITVYYFGFVSLWAPVSNLVLSFAVSAALSLGVAGVAARCLPLVGKWLCLPCFLGASVFIEYFAAVVTLIGKTGVGRLEIDSNKNIYCFFIAVAFILLVRILCKNRVKERKRHTLYDGRNLS